MRSRYFSRGHWLSASRKSETELSRLLLTSITSLHLNGVVTKSRRLVQVPSILQMHLFKLLLNGEVKGGGKKSLSARGGAWTCWCVSTKSTACWSEVKRQTWGCARVFKSNAARICVFHQCEPACSLDNKPKITRNMQWDYGRSQRNEQTAVGLSLERLCAAH